MDAATGPARHGEAMTERTKGLLFWTIFLLTIYFVIAQLTFGFRHPWATDTERLLNIHNAMLFRSVPYKMMRPRE